MSLEPLSFHTFNTRKAEYSIVKQWQLVVDIEFSNHEM